MNTPWHQPGEWRLQWDPALERLECDWDESQWQSWGGAKSGMKTWIQTHFLWQLKGERSGYLRTQITVFFFLFERMATHTVCHFPRIKHPRSAFALSKINTILCQVHMLLATGCICWSFMKLGNLALIQGWAMCKWDERVLPRYAEERPMQIQPWS